MRSASGNAGFLSNEKTPGICSIGSGDDIVSSDRGFERREGCRISRASSGGTLPRVLAAREQTTPFGKSGWGREKSTEPPWEEQPRCPALLVAGEGVNRESPSSAASPPQRCGARGRAAAPAPSVPPVRPKRKKKSPFPHPIPPVCVVCVCFFFSPTALSLPLLKVNVLPSCFSDFFPRKYQPKPSPSRVSGCFKNNNNYKRVRVKELVFTLNKALRKGSLKSLP